MAMHAYALKKPHTEEEKNELKEYPELLQELLMNRGVRTKEEADTFLNPNYDTHLHDPFLIKDMGKAVSRILRAIEKGERIAIWSDYDCDGIPGGVLLHDFFKKIAYANVLNYIPHRHNEGYGLNVNAIDTLKGDGVSLIVTVDVGITDVEQVKHANKHSIDVVITDHHLPNGTLPPAYAVVNSKREDDTYPFDQLCGSGVAYKLVQALIQKGDFGLTPGWEKWLLDVAGLATIADMVPLVGENRVLAYYGLKVLRKSPRKGLIKLYRKMNLEQRTITEDDVGYMIAPRINAASRMDRPEEAFRLLATDDDVEAGILADHLHKINNERKGTVAAMVREIKKEVGSRGEKDVIVIGNPKWRPALLGLAANTLVEEYGKTVCLWGEEGLSTQAGGRVLKGSCRSNGSVNVVELMKRSESILIEYGGHQFSGGFSVTREHIHRLEEVFLDSYTHAKQKEHDTAIVVDKKLWLDDVTSDTYRLIERLAPFGEGNPKPTFLFEGVEISGVRHFGKGNDHLELTFQSENGKTIPAIVFFKGENDFNVTIKPGAKIHLVAHIEHSTFGRTQGLRLRIVDIR
ncbi:single-stranded-DNA-specific exonuclease RecJ [Candidatus Kaiserbacteria bacterium]|nr:single-stranded-DNA-specific exonuclease RecJ [Candidatus Kaiserbacteria bacterium]